MSTEGEKPNNFQSKFSVALFSDPNFLASSILENLLSKNCVVNVITDDEKGWLGFTSGIAAVGRFSIIKADSISFMNPEYAIVVAGYTKGDPYTAASKIFSRFDLRKTKTIVALPFEKYSLSKATHSNLTDRIAVVYLGDVVGPRIDLESDLLVAYLIQALYYKKRATVGVGEAIYPIFVADVSRTLSKWLFSFGPYGKETLLLGPQTSPGDIWKRSREILGPVDLSYDNSIQERRIPKNLEIKRMATDIDFVLRETYRWVSRIPSKPKSRPPPLPAKKKPGATKNTRRLRPLFLVFAAFALFPVFLLLINLFIFFLSYRQFLAGRDGAAENSLQVAKTISVVAKAESAMLSYIPLVGRVYDEIEFASRLSEGASDVGIVAIPVARESADLVNSIFGNEVYDSQRSSEVIKTGLERLYEIVSVIQAETEDGISHGLIFARAFGRKLDMEKIRSLVLHGSRVAGNVPNLTGQKESKTYLLLFQNNMELRPTGGFIGSYGLLTLDGGRIVDLTVSDVYSADGQLKGHVEPPGPIKDYLGEANWWLRDSNWDPDFPTSAKRAEWFLDKEIGRQVDGVLAIDLEPIRNVLEVTGPVFLADYNLNITSGNLYERTQTEVEENFFPGTHKKASFLTALSRNLLAEISKLDTKQKMSVSHSFYRNLEGRHVQVFVHESETQTAIANIGWDGSVVMPNCGDGCFADLVGTVEANIGVNKANYFVERSQDLFIETSPDRIERRLVVTLENKANPQLSYAGRYKVYLRLLATPGSEIVAARVSSGDVWQDISPEIADYKNRREAGVLVEVLGEQKKKVEFVWETKNINEEAPVNKYGLYVRKQGGVGSDPFSLTVNGASVYNSTLANDYFIRLPI